MRIFEKSYILLFFIFRSCDTDPYIKQMPSITPGNEVIL